MKNLTIEENEHIDLRKGETIKIGFKIESYTLFEKMIFNKAISYPEYGFTTIKHADNKYIVVIKHRFGQQESVRR